QISASRELAEKLIKWPDAERMQVHHKVTQPGIVIWACGGDDGGGTRSWLTTRLGLLPRPARPQRRRAVRHAAVDSVFVPGWRCSSARSSAVSASSTRRGFGYPVRF